MTLPNAKFERIHALGADPWATRSSWYEARKRQLLAAILPRRRYRSAFEPGCSVGELTAVLATRCERVLAWDLSENALRSARLRLSNTAEVILENRRIPDEWPDTAFDLIVISEIAYYLPDDRLPLLCRRIEESLSEDGDVVLCHWRHPLEGWPLDGDRVHAALEQNLRLPILSRLEEADFRISVLSRLATSVAQREGIR